MAASEKPLRIDIPVRLIELRIAFNIADLAFEGDLPASIFHLQLIANDIADWKAKVSEGMRESFWLQGMMADFPAAYFCIKAFSETDQTNDLKHIDVPTLIMQGDDDQIVPFGIAGQLQSQLVRGATLKVYKGAPHGLCTTHKHQVNEDLLAFLKA